MAFFRLADLIVQVEGASDTTQREMQDYRISQLPAGRRPDIQIRVTPSMTARERRLEGGGFSDSYLESIAVYRAFCEQALKYDVMFFHASAVGKGGLAYLFTGPSGSGKSTQAQMWCRAFSDAFVINDDKPLIRFLADGPYVYGAPWDGKRHLNINTRVKIAGICLVKKSSSDSIRRLTYQEAQDPVRSQLFRAETCEHRVQNLKLGNLLLNSVPVYELLCTATPHAAAAALEGMCSEGRRRVDHRTVCRNPLFFD